MKGRVVWLILGCLMVGVLVLASCAPAAVEEEGKTIVDKVLEEEEKVVTPAPAGPQYGGVLNLALATDILGFDEAFHHHREVTTLHLTNEELLQGDWTKGPAGTGEADWILGGINRMEHKAPSLAESWEIPEKGKMVFRIRQGVHWHNKAPVNGRELTADDIVFSLKRACSEPRSYIKSNYPSLAESAVITAPDKWTVVIECPPEEFGNAVTLFPDFVSIVPQEVIEEYGDINDWKNSCGTGPFMLIDYVPNSSATLERNPAYWDVDPIGPGKGNKLPYLDGVKYLVITDLSTRIAALRSGKIDGAAAIEYDGAVTIMHTNPELSYKQYVYDSCYAIYMRTDDPASPFSDIRVRQALFYATDHERIRDEYYSGKAEILVWPIIYTREYKNAYVPLEDLPENVRQLYEHHPDKARQLLAEAGYPDGFKVKIYCYNTPTQVDYLSQIKAFWAEVGIELEVDARDYAVWVGRVVTRNYEELLYGYNSGIDTFFKMSNYNGPSIFNGSRVDDARVKEVYAGMQEYVGFDEAKMDELYAGLMPYLLEQCYVLATPNPYLYTFWWPWVKNYHGELNVGYYNVGSDYKYRWLDLDLRKAMTGR